MLSCLVMCTLCWPNLIIILDKTFHLNFAKDWIVSLLEVSKQSGVPVFVSVCACVCVCVCVCVVESVPNDSAGEEPALFEGTDSSHKAGCAYIPRVTVWTQPANDQNARRGRINCSRPLATGQGREGCGSPWVAPCTLHKIFVQTFLRSASWFLYIISVQIFHSLSISVQTFLRSGSPPNVPLARQLEQNHLPMCICST